MLRRRRAALVHGALRAVRADGADARGWLHDLVTADVASLRPGDVRPSLLLSPTGRIRAAFAVAADAGGYLLLQADDQPDLGAILAPYVLSSAVALGRDPRAFASVPDAALDGTEPDATAADATWRPSLLPTSTPSGALLAIDADRLAPLRARWASTGVAEATPADAERLRIEEGVPRFPVDVSDASLPAEAGWEDRIDLTKGCFLGQESVAKVRNLGHPPRVVRAFATDVPLAVGDAIVADGEPVGAITSAVDVDGGGRAIGHVGWAARDAALATAAGVRLVRA